MEDEKEYRPKHLPLFKILYGKLFDKPYNVRVEDRILTTSKGLDIQCRSMESFQNDNLVGLEIYTYILDKYHQEPSASSSASMLLGDFYSKHKMKESYLEDIKRKLRPETKGKGEYVLDLIEVEERYKNQGIGSLTYKLSEYLFAKYLDRKNIIEGSVNGYCMPMDYSKERETRDFYYKQGFQIFMEDDRETYYRDVLYKPVIAEQVLGDRANRIFEKVGNVREYLE